MKNQSEAKKDLFKHYFKDLKKFFLGKIKMFELLDDTPSSVLSLFLFLKNKKMEKIKLSHEDIVYYLQNFKEYFSEGEKIIALTTAQLRDNLLTKEKNIYFYSDKNFSASEYAFAVIEKNGDSFNVDLKYLDQQLPSKKGVKIIVCLT